MPKQNNPNEPDLRALYRRLILLNEEAFASGEYSMVYHILMAALHAAQSLNDIQSLSEVKRLATEQLAWIDAHHPEYEHSTPSASKRGHDNIFKNLMSQANTRIRMIEHEAKWGRE